MCDDNLSSIGQAGCIKAVVYSMKAHPSDRQLQAVCCNLLYKLAHDATNAALIIDSNGGAKAILAALSLPCAGLRDVHKNATLLLGCLAKDPTHAHLLCQEGVKKAVQNLMKSYDSDAAVRQTAKEALDLLKQNGSKPKTITVTVKL
jgi:hypothetical protein